MSLFDCHCQKVHVVLPIDDTAKSCGNHVQKHPGKHPTNHPYTPCLFPASQLRIHFFTSMEPRAFKKKTRDNASSPKYQRHTSRVDLILTEIFVLEIQTNKFLGFIYKNTLTASLTHCIFFEFRLTWSYTPRKLPQIPVRIIHFDPHLLGAHTFAKLELPYETYTWAGFGESTFSGLEYTYRTLLLQSINGWGSTSAMVTVEMGIGTSRSPNGTGTKWRAKDHVLGQFQQISLDSHCCMAWLQGTWNQTLVVEPTIFSFFFWLNFHERS